MTYVRNITDIEDKIIAAAAEADESVEVLAERMAARFAAGYEALGVLAPDHEPKATEHIPEMIDMIRSPHRTRTGLPGRRRRLFLGQGR